MRFQIKRLDHIGIATGNLEESLKFYQTLLGLQLTGIEEIKDQKVKTAFLQVNDINLELLVPTADDSSVKKFLSKGRAGVHHIALEVDDIGSALNELEKQGIELIDKTPRIGAHNKKIAFIHPKETDGVLIELCESE